MAPALGPGARHHRAEYRARTGIPHHHPTLFVRRAGGVGPLWRLPPGRHGEAPEGFLRFRPDRHHEAELLERLGGNVAHLLGGVSLAVTQAQVGALRLEAS